MVNETKTDRDSLLAQLKHMLASVTPDIAKVSFSDQKDELAIDVDPRSDDFCKFWIGIGHYGTYDVCFGHGLCIEELPIQKYPIDKVILAILSGDVTETVWELSGRVVRTAGTISFGKDLVLQDKSIVHPLGILGVGKKREISYRPYPGHA